MKCPVCKEVELKMAERCNVEIDYCPECRGVWLDRGELDKIIERTMGAEAPRQSNEAPRQGYGAPPPPYAEHREHDSHHDHRYEDAYRHGHDKHHDDDHYHYDKHHKRKSFLSELFDFG